MSTPDTAIDLRGLRKRYGTVDALAGLDLQVPRGSIFGFLGRNGAGKTTTIKALMGMIRVTGGEGFVLGHRNPCTGRVALRRTESHFRELAGAPSRMVFFWLPSGDRQVQAESLSDVGTGTPHSAPGPGD